VLSVTPGEEAVVDLGQRLEDLARRADIKDIRDHAALESLRTYITTEIAAMHKDLEVIDASLAAAVKRVEKQVSDVESEMKDNYVPVTRFSTLEKVFWALILAVLLGLIGGAISILTGQPGGVSG
jgi:hypothetical protein